MKSEPTTYNRQRQALARELRALRELGAVSGNQFAKRLEWAQSKVSRIETGAQIPSEADVEAWCAALGLSPGERGRLLSILEQAEAEYRGWRQSYALAGGASAKQRDVQRLEARASEISEFQPSVVPGLLQTPAYAAEVLRRPHGPLMFESRPAEIDAMMAVRMERQTVLYTPGKNVRVVILEAALRTRVCSLATLAEQRFRLLDVCQLSSVSLSVVPTAAELPIVPLGGFAIYDDCVVIETMSGEQQLSSAGDVELYAGAFKALWSAGLRGDDARQFIRNVAEGA